MKSALTYQKRKWFPCVKGFVSKTPQAKTEGAKLFYLQLFLFITMANLPDLLAQSEFKLSGTKSSLTILGTSTLHDWTMNVSEFNCTINALMDETILKQIVNSNFACQVQKIVSESSMMDSKAHTALQMDKFPEIGFKSESVELISDSPGVYSGKIKGNLTIAGITKPILFSFSCKMIDKMTLDANGIINLKMSDYNIKPPTAMLGTLKAGDDISLKFELEFVKID